MITRRHGLALTGAALATAALPARAATTTSAEPAAAAAAAAAPFELAEPFRRQEVRVRDDFAPGHIVVLSSQHFLYYILGGGKALRFGVAVGREGLGFRGETLVGRKAEWPSWRPTPEMIARSPRYARWADGMPGGPGNPLGARALYLYQNGRDTAIRIHGTTEPESIGRSVSNGCIRMVNEHVVEVYALAPVGTRVTVY
jgi:lipoprotein-anchoring transpeptidase ErfK/SrfK